jgi:Uma2 family endonuclease
VRSPDVSLVTRSRVNILPYGHALATAAPDLAVEVLSREQYGEAYARPKVGEYLSSGAKVVWLVDPETRTVRVYEPNRDEYAVYSAEATIELEQIAPGFSALVASFFP